MQGVSKTPHYEFKQNMFQSLRQGQQYFPEGINSNIFIVEENRPSFGEEQKPVLQKLKRINKLHNYINDRDEENFEFPVETAEYKHIEFIQTPIAYQTIESEDRNKILTQKSELFDESKISFVDQNLTQTNTQEDLENLLRMIK